MKLMMLVALLISPLWAQRRAEFKDMEYPPFAAQAGERGIVVLDTEVNSQGDVGDIHVVSGKPLLVEASIGNLKQAKFDPGNTEKIRVNYMFMFGDKHERLTYDAKTGTAVITGVRPTIKPATSK